MRDTRESSLAPFVALGTLTYNCPRCNRQTVGAHECANPECATVAAPRSDLCLLLDAFRIGMPVEMTFAHRDAYERLRVVAGMDRYAGEKPASRPRWLR